MIDRKIDFSRDAAKRMIRILYDQQDLLVGDDVPGEDINRQFGIDIPDTFKFACLMPFLDENIYVYHCMNLAFIASAAAEDKSAILNYQFSNATHEFLVAIRLLVSRGLDLAVRTHLRPLYELGKTWLLVKIDKEARSAFEACGDFKDTNTFWHKYNRNSKGEKLIEERLGEIGKYSPLIAEHLPSFLEVVGAVIHPSHVALKFAASTNFLIDSDSLVYGNIESSSLFVLSQVLFLCMIPLQPFQSFQFTIPQGLPHIGPAHKTGKSANEVCAVLQNMPTWLWVASQEFSVYLAPGDPGGKKQSFASYKKALKSKISRVVSGTR